MLNERFVELKRWLRFYLSDKELVLKVAIATVVSFVIVVLIIYKVTSTGTIIHVAPNQQSIYVYVNTSYIDAEYIDDEFDSTTTTTTTTTATVLSTTSTKLVGDQNSTNRSEIFPSPKLPFTIRLREGLIAGLTVEIKGKVMSNASIFAVNFQKEDGNYPKDLAYHFNMRYYDGSPYICINNRVNGTWVNEIRVNKNPFPRGSQFFILIVVSARGFTFQANSEVFYFNHRNDLNDGNYFQVVGDLDVNSIQIINP